VATEIILLISQTSVEPKTKRQWELMALGEASWEEQVFMVGL
jgi:hypothetical protein